MEATRFSSITGMVHEMIDTFTLSLMTGIFVGISSGYIGSLMVLKKMALVGDALSHVALPGLALGMLFNFNPFIGGFAFLFLAALATGYLERITKLSMEAIIGVLFTLSLAVGILITPEAELLEALFGDITNINMVDTAIAAAISVFAVIVARLIYNKIVLSTISEELAVSRGINIQRVNIIYLLLVALVVAVGIKIAGTLLVGALVVVPAAAAKNVSPNQRRYAVLSAAFGVASSISGIILSSYLGLHAGPLIVLSSIIIFFATVPARRLR